MIPEIFPAPVPPLPFRTAFRDLKRRIELKIKGKEMNWNRRKRHVIYHFYKTWK